MTDPPAAHVITEGQPGGPCAVLVHGLEDRWSTWTRVAHRLGPAWRTVALDLPWRAGNDYGWRWVRSPADWVRSGLDAIDADSVVLIGHSFGANALLARLAAGEPRARAAQLLCPLFRPDSATVTWQTFDQARLAFLRQIEDGIRTRLRTVVEADIVESMLARTCERIGPMGFLTTFDEYVSSGHLPLSAVDIPVSVLVGEDDPIMFRPYAEELARRLPRAQIACWADFGHFGHLRRADDVAGAVRALLEEPDGWPGSAAPPAVRLLRDGADGAIGA